MGISVDDAVAVAMALPEVARRPYGTDAVNFRVRDRSFAYLNEVAEVALVKATLDEHEALVMSDPEVFSPAWSSGRFGWVRVRLPLVDPVEYAELVTEAWRLSAPRRLVATFGTQ